MILLISAGLWISTAEWRNDGTFMHLLPGVWNSASALMLVLRRLFLFSMSRGEEWNLADRSLTVLFSCSFLAGIIGAWCWSV
jgi:hypothetical protein